VALVDFGARRASIGAGMDSVTLKLKILTLKVIVALSYVTGESLRRTFEHECLELHERRTVFARWHQVRRDCEAARSALELLIRQEYGFGTHYGS
jgi:hypothetical protein